MAIKQQFGADLSSEHEIALQNEAVCKALCHNICTVIDAMYAMDLNPEFTVEENEDAVEKKYWSSAIKSTKPPEGKYLYVIICGDQVLRKFLMRGTYSKIIERWRIRVLGETAVTIYMGIHCY